ncbi:uncharacterized protein TRAVEDRAFT_25481 [Trametes versicolor FP-101664 SS1]|uniref:uncharacterized protein n=1 Tax=Trametes versicolor (strain FP-101664) TaxID=717944 RepID=UPI00046217B6|nr:uncharacterized protein TRAVEDRAFT_25481 [Trametes versicolor FP-101664 SS1]EIW64240.1 hypothetical protein TRAVEDRAFT_25481 [Trametes versicolor FP-101664 SS1]
MPADVKCSTQSSSSDCAWPNCECGPKSSEPPKNKNCGSSSCNCGATCACKPGECKC